MKSLNCVGDMSSRLQLFPDKSIPALTVVLRNGTFWDDRNWQCMCLIVLNPSVVQELLGVFRHWWGWPHCWVGAAVPMPWLYQVGAPNLPAALGRREAARQQHSTRGLSPVQRRVPHCLPQAGYVLRCYCFLTSKLKEHKTLHRCAFVK